MPFSRRFARNVSWFGGGYRLGEKIIRARARAMKKRWGRRPVTRPSRRLMLRGSSKKSWQARARVKVGNPRNYSSCKTNESVDPTVIPVQPVSNPAGGDYSTGINTKTISATPLIVISGTASNSINGRQRDMCIVSGIKVSATFKNQNPNRVYVNWAIVHAKQGQVIGPGTLDFFRDYKNERTFNASHTGKSGITSSCAEINTDEFVVMKRGKFLLTPVGTATAGIQGYNFGGQTKEKNFYLKLGRSFYFDDGSDEPQDQLYFVVWVAIPEDGAGTTQAVLQYKLRAITYFREPKCG